MKSAYVKRRGLGYNPQSAEVKWVLPRPDSCSETPLYQCHAWEIPLDEAGAFGAALDAAYRKKLGLLSASEIRAARERLRMSQREFAEYIGVGEASIKRWELGALQDKSGDELIRLKTDPAYARGSFNRLCSRLSSFSAGELPKTRRSSNTPKPRKRSPQKARKSYSPA